MLRPIVRPVTQPIAFSLNGRKPFHVPTYLLGRVIDIIGDNEGAVFDVAAAFARNAIWEDSARTTPASVDGPVGSIQDELERYYAEQATSGARPVLRTDGAGKYWLDADGAQWLSYEALADPADSYLISAGLYSQTTTGARYLFGNYSGNTPVGGHSVRASQLVNAAAVLHTGDSAVTVNGSILPPQAVVSDSQYTSGYLDSRTNGIIASPSVSTRSANAKLTTRLLSWGQTPTGGTSWVGRFYVAAKVAAVITPGHRSVFQRWAAARSGAAI